jgi:hypothetical protein
MITEKRETVSLIGSDKVQGTAVYGADGEKIGAIERVMIEKISGTGFRTRYSALAASSGSVTTTIRCRGLR